MTRKRSTLDDLEESLRTRLC